MLETVRDNTITITIFFIKVQIWNLNLIRFVVCYLHISIFISTITESCFCIIIVQGRNCILGLIVK